MSYRLAEGRNTAVALVCALVSLFFIATPMAAEAMTPMSAAAIEQSQNSNGTEAAETSEAADEALPTDGEDPLSEDEDASAEGEQAIAEGEDLAEGEDGEAEAANWGRYQPIADLVEAGGPVIIILGILSVISLMVIVVKLVQFTLLRVGDHRFVETIWAKLRDGDLDGALAAVSKRKGVISRVMETALHGRKIAGDSPAAREEVERVARAKIDGLERGLPLLSLIATISPLLGLLGTVLGMIEAFQQLETAGDRVDPAILSGGIWEALLTTAAGLSVAIPAAAFFSWLQHAVDDAAQHMEDAAIRVFTFELYDTSSSDDEA